MRTVRQRTAVRLFRAARPRAAILALLLAVSLGLTLAACGRKGRLEAPPGANPARSNVSLPGLGPPSTLY